MSGCTRFKKNNNNPETIKSQKNALIVFRRNSKSVT